MMEVIQINCLGGTVIILNLGKVHTQFLVRMYTAALSRTART